MSECTLALLTGTFHGRVDGAVQRRRDVCRLAPQAAARPQMSGYLAEGFVKARQGQGKRRSPDGHTTSKPAP